MTFATGQAAQSTMLGTDALARHATPKSFLVVPRTNAILCDAITMLLRSGEETLCQSLTGDVHQIRWMLATAPRSVCLLDNPNEALCRALADVPNGPPIVLLVPSDVRAIQLRMMMKLKPLAIVGYDASIQELREGLEAAGRGERFLGESMRGLVHIDSARDRFASSVPSPLDDLTARQLEVAKWLAEGYTIAEVAGIMELAEKTVESHRYRIMGRLNLASRVELTRLLVQEGVVSRNYRPRSTRKETIPAPKASKKVAAHKEGVLGSTESIALQ